MSKNYSRTSTNNWQRNVRREERRRQMMRDAARIRAAAWSKWQAQCVANGWAFNRRGAAEATAHGMLIRIAPDIATLVFESGNILTARHAERLALGASVGEIFPNLYDPERSK